MDLMAYFATLPVRSVLMAFNVAEHVSQNIQMKHVTIFMDISKVSPQEPKQTPQVKKAIFYFGVYLVFI